MCHLNDAKKFGLMRQIGVELEFSNACVLLGDKIYQEDGEIMALYDAAMRRKCRKLNNHIRLTIERPRRTCYCGTEAVYDYIVHLRPLLSQTVTICAGGDL